MNITPLYCEKVFEEQLKKIDSIRRQKVMQCKNQADKCRSLGGGLLLQYALNGKRETEVLEILYGSGIDGKPYLKGFPNLFFNLSHSGSYVVLAMSNQEVGVDLQEIKPTNFKIAKRFFTKEEAESVESIQEEEQKSRMFFRLWAAKESYIKLTGKGLAQGLDTFLVQLEQFTIWDNLEQKASGFLKEIRFPDKTYIMMVCSKNNEFEDMEMAELNIQ